MYFYCTKYCFITDLGCFGWFFRISILQSNNIFSRPIPTSTLHNSKTSALHIILTIEQSRKQTGWLGNNVACSQAMSFRGSFIEYELSSVWTDSKKGRVSRAVAVLSDPHSSRPSYIKELLRDIICLKTQSKHHLLCSGIPLNYQRLLPCCFVVAVVVLSRIIFCFCYILLAVERTI